MDQINLKKFGKSLKKQSQTESELEKKEETTNNSSESSNEEIEVKKQGKVKRQSKGFNLFGFIFGSFFLISSTVSLFFLFNNRSKFSR